ncbi:MAG TPA: 2OG-Fe(II) oxygenase [Gammaproteobacteria bacterium]|nr:2OG-Fe(II) oxygenase [Gammaproteobacteria bacterium]
MTGTGISIANCFVRSLKNSEKHTHPFPYWLLKDVLPQPTVDAILALPVEPAKVAYTMGTREYNNASRTYFDAENLKRYKVCNEVAEALQSREAVTQVEQTFGINLKNSFLRLEYAQDSDGFWLEPHTDIRVKLLSLLIYLSKEPEAETLGTDIYDGNKKFFKSTPFKSNHALAFVPAADTWHALDKRPFPCVRRTLIVNYVTNEWRNRFELAYPEMPISY